MFGADDDLKFGLSPSSAFEIDILRVCFGSSAEKVFEVYIWQDLPSAEMTTCGSVSPIKSKFLLSMTKTPPSCSVLLHDVS